MESKIDKTIVISVGGSLIVPNEIDVAWLRQFKEFIESKVKQGFRFIIVAGGGKTARNYEKAARELGVLSIETRDWIGIQATKINAQLIKSIFKEVHPDVIYNPNEKINFKEKILVAAGWKPGCSTDYDTVLIAKNFGARKLVNLSNIDYVYDKDPNEHKDAKKIENISWKEFRKIVGDKWNPGLNAPFDPIASKEAEKLAIEVVLMNGKNFNNIGNYLNNKKFIGTIIK